MPTKLMSLSLSHSRFVLWFVFLLVLFLNVAGVASTNSVVYASLTGTLQTSDNSNPLRSDFNGDGVVNILDFGIVSLAWYSCPGNPNWNPTVDLNDDDIVNILDIVLVMKDLGKRWVNYGFDEPLSWNVVKGTWSVVNGSLDGFSSAEGLICSEEIAWEECTLTARVKILPDSPKAEAAFTICFGDSGSFYWAGLGCWDHRVSISRMTSHVPEELIFGGVEADVLGDVWYVLSIRVSGDALMLYVNDVLELVTKDSSLASGRVGIRLWNSHILVDYITVSGYALTPKPEAISPMLKGVSWYGIGSGDAVDLYKMTEEYFGFLVETFPDMNFLCLPVGAHKVMPNIYQQDYDTVDYQRLNLLKDFVSWSEAQNIKILIVNYWKSLDEARLKAYWKFMAQQFKDDDTIIGFDLVNEPWSFAHGNKGLLELYERIIDAIRSVDSGRTCYVQSMYYHYESAAWRDVLTSNPVNRSNVVYVSHLYSNNYATGEWYNDNNHPWVPYYLNHDYEKARAVLENALYKRFGFIQELGYSVALTEVAFIATEEGLTYGRDVLEILNDWNIDWAYHPWYTNVNRPAALTYPDGSLRPQATIVQGGL